MNTYILKQDIEHPYGNIKKGTIGIVHAEPYVSYLFFPYEGKKYDKFNAYDRTKGIILEMCPIPEKWVEVVTDALDEHNPTIFGYVEPIYGNFNLTEKDVTEIEFIPTSPNK